MSLSAELDALDRDDPLGHLRGLFALPDGITYLDGNSLGALPAATAAQLQRVVSEQWGTGLIGSWNSHDWIGMPARVGARIAPLVGAEPDEVLVADTTTINIFKLAAAALALRPGRRTIVMDADDFPTDLYILQGLAELLGDVTLRCVPAADIPAAIDHTTAVLLLSQVNYRSGARADMAGLTAYAQSRGALTLWDLCHSAGAMRVALNACNADLAVGCGYKFLNGGPGAPSFLYAARRHHPAIRSPLSGWLGHEAPFDFQPDYVAADGMRRLLCSTPHILSMAALEAGLAIWDGVDLAAVEAKATRLTELFIRAVEQRCPSLRLASPRDAAHRGAHVCFAHPGAYPIMQALIARSVIGDVRAPDLLRFGFVPATTRYADVGTAVATLADILDRGTWQNDRYAIRGVVT